MNRLNLLHLLKKVLAVELALGGDVAVKDLVYQKIVKIKTLNSKKGPLSVTYRSRNGRIELLFELVKLAGIFPLEGLPGLIRGGKEGVPPVLVLQLVIPPAALAANLEGSEELLLRAELLQERLKGNAQNAVNDVENAVGGAKVGLKRGGIDAAQLYCKDLGVLAIAH